MLYNPNNWKAVVAFIILGTKAPSYQCETIKLSL